MNDIYTFFRYLNFIMGMISILGCFFIILIFTIFKSIRSFAMEQVIYLSFSCMVCTFSYILQGLNFDNVKLSSDTLICNIQSFLMVWFENSQYISAVSIAYSVYRSVIYLDDLGAKNTRIRRMKYLFVLFVLPMIFAGFGLQFSFYGPADFWCYIKKDKEKEIRIFFFISYSIIWISIILSCYFNL